MIWIYWRDMAIFYKHIVWSHLLLSDIEMLFIVETTTPATAFYLVVFPRKQQFKQCFSSVQFSLSVVSNSLQPRGLQHARPPCPSATPGVHWKLMSIESVMPSNCLILCYPLLLLPSIFPSIRLFSKESVLRIRWPKYWSFSFSISPSSEYSGLISFRIDWFDLLTVHGTLKAKQCLALFF